MRETNKKKKKEKAVKTFGRKLFQISMAHYSPKKQLVVNLLQVSIAFPLFIYSFPKDLLVEILVK